MIWLLFLLLLQDPRRDPWLDIWLQRMERDYERARFEAAERRHQQYLRNEYRKALNEVAAALNAVIKDEHESVYDAKRKKKLAFDKAVEKLRKTDGWK